MADTTQTYTEQPASGGKGKDSPIKVDGHMVGLTWLTFGILALLLYKVAWKPILAALDQREKQLRDALEEARLTREEYAQLDERRKQLIDEADAKARQIVEQARQAAIETSRTIEAKARDEANILLANAQREISSAHEKAVADLRRESADLAVGLTRKILADQLDEPRSRSLVDRLLTQV
ncbi:MAG TPA: F0F1 ATP synthase subunit B [Kiritimatiellia bacterium]|nr:F0F1 ATP synthase subunit B [Kiritimatiellia bacterium]